MKGDIKQVYLASRVSRLDEMIYLSHCFNDTGLYEVCARWPWADHKTGHANRSGMLPEERATIAERDLHDIRVADIVVLFAESPETNCAGNGRLTEFGYAMGRHKELWVVGPLENLFMCVSAVKRHFPETLDLTRWLSDQAIAEEDRRSSARSAHPSS